MKTALQKLVVCASCLVLAGSALGQTYSGNIVGYINLVLQPGINLIADQFLNTPDNSLDSNLTGGGLANGTSFTMWSNGAFLPTSYYDAGTGAWSINYELNLGQGGYLISPTLVTNVFAGSVGPYFDLNSGNTNNINWTPNYADGLHLISNPTPIAGNLNYEFSNVTGRAPVAGEMVSILDPVTQTYDNNYFDGTQWIDQGTGNPSTAILPVGQAAWFSLGQNSNDLNIPSPVPEPGVFVLVGMGAGLLFLRRRQPCAALGQVASDGVKPRGGHAVIRG